MGLGRTAVLLLGFAAVSACGSSQSLWLKDATVPSSPTAPVTPPTPSVAGDRSCWDGCRSKFRDGTIDLGDCVGRCPGVEKRPVPCPKDSGAHCVDDQGGVLLLVLVGAVLLGLGIGGALALAL